MFTQPCSSPCSTRSSIGSWLIEGSFPSPPLLNLAVRSSPSGVLPDPCIRAGRTARGLRPVRHPRPLPQRPVFASVDRHAFEGAVHQAVVPEDEHGRARAPESRARKRDAQAPEGRPDPRPAESAGGSLAAFCDRAARLHGGDRGAGGDAGAREPPDAAHAAENGGAAAARRRRRPEEAQEALIQLTDYSRQVFASIALIDSASSS